MSYRCAHCGGSHEQAARARACAAGQTVVIPTQRTNSWPVSQTQIQTAAIQSVSFDPITDKQLDYIKNRLNGDPVYAAKLTKSQASSYIDRLKKARVFQVPNSPHTTAPNRVKTIVPLDMLDAALNGGTEGRFAVRPDSTQPFTFFRVTKPKSGRFAGCLKVQTQHGPNYQIMLAVWPGGNITVYDKSYEQDLLLVVVDPNGGKIAYGQELGFCGICGKELTDPRSRWYGIGPDCEKRHHLLIEIVNDTKGVFRFGQS